MYGHYNVNARFKPRSQRFFENLSLFATSFLLACPSWICYFKVTSTYIFLGLTFLNRCDTQELDGSGQDCYFGYYVYSFNEKSEVFGKLHDYLRDYLFSIKHTKTYDDTAVIFV